MSAFHARIQSLFSAYLAENKAQHGNALTWGVPKRHEADGLRRCAVLCCLREEGDEVLVLVTTRSHKLSSHPGEPCLPGGKEEPSDVSLVDTALREAEEEVALKREHVKVVTSFPPIIHGFHKILQYHLVVCTLTHPNVDELELVASSEVDSIHWVPLRFFLGGGYHCWHEKVPYSNDTAVTVDFFRVIEETDTQRAVVVWGSTARMCVIVACVVFSQPPSFPFTLHYIDSVDQYTIKQKHFFIPGISSLSKL